MSDQDRDTNRADEPAAAESDQAAQPPAGATEPAAPAAPEPPAATAPSNTTPSNTAPSNTAPSNTAPSAGSSPDATPAADTPPAGTPAAQDADASAAAQDAGTPAEADAGPAQQIDGPTEILPAPTPEQSAAEPSTPGQVGSEPSATDPTEPTETLPGAAADQAAPTASPQTGGAAEQWPTAGGVPAGTDAQWTQPADQPADQSAEQADRAAADADQAAAAAGVPAGAPTPVWGQPDASGQPLGAGATGQPYGTDATGQFAGLAGTDATGQFAAQGVDPSGAYQTQQVPPYGPGGGPGAWQQPGPFGSQPAKPRTGRRWLAAGAAAVVLVLGGGVVGGVTVHALEGNGVTESPVVSTPVSSKGGSLANMVAQVQPSVVSLKVQPDNSQSGDEGSGVIIRSDGMILTNNHVVSSVAKAGGSITVTFSDGKQASAKVVGTDPAGDLAVVQAQGKSGLKPATLGDSSKMRVGDGVVAIGSPLGLEGSVTQGIVSALNRSYSVSAEDEQPQQQNQNPFNFGRPNQNKQQQQSSGSTITIPNAIQTDAAINPGNSGGPLLNMAGQVIGINSAIRGAGSSSGEAGSIGIGFAIPINTAKSTADQLIDGKKVQHALFGVKVGDAVSDGQSASGTPQGALVADVTKGGPAAKAGLKKGDVITEVDGTKVTDSASLVSVISEHKPGDKVKVTYSRNGSTKTTTATLTKSSD